MKSMTGFGTGDAPLDPGKLTVEVRSVNHRYLDVRVRLPQEFVDQSMFLEQRARERLTRGRFDIGVRYEGPLPAARLDVERAINTYRELERLRDQLSPGETVPIAALFALPNIYSAPSTLEPAGVQRALGAAFDVAVRGLERMRAQEGEALARELAGRIAACRALHDQITERLPEASRTLAARVRARVERLLADVSATLDPSRIEAEIALLAERGDVTEELVRLDSHFAQLESLLAMEEPSGRRLDFLLQEMAREANTVGAKSQEAELGHRVVELKSDIERMREQVQNVE